MRIRAWWSALAVLPGLEIVERNENGVRGLSWEEAREGAETNEEKTKSAHYSYYG